MIKVQLSPMCIKNVPLQAYAQDFSFIVNGEEFKTSFLLAELISRRICHIHASDPTLDRFIIKTEHRGDFSQIIELSNFCEVNISENDSAFFSEVVRILDIDSIHLNRTSEEEEEKSVDNIVQLIKKHEHLGSLYEEQLLSEIDFASSHFNELIKKNKEELKSLSAATIQRIIINDELRLTNEDELINFVNELYSIDRIYSICYEGVLFENVTSENICEFINIYDSNDITRTLWLNISRRLQREIKKSNSNESNDWKGKKEKNRYCDSKEENKEIKEKEEGIKFLANNDSHFCGIINHLRSQSNKIENEINITASSCGESGERYQPKTVIIYENKNNFFFSNDTPNSWLCIDFKDRRVIPTDYEIRSLCGGTNSVHLKSWKIEGSTDNETWTTLDEQTNCSSLNGNNFVHRFHINQKQNTNNKYRYIRIQETNKNWRNDDHLSFNVIEIYGTLI